jgi:hypothetical protein
MKDGTMRRAMLVSSALALGLIAGSASVGLAENVTARNSTTAENAAPAGEICVADYKQLAAKLQQTYAEEPVSAGLGQDGNLVSVFASSSTGTWTMVLTRPEGTSCVVAVGEAWQMKTPVGFQPPA